MLHVQHIELAFGSRRLFDDLCWQLRPGDRVGLVGPNGAGKTTLLRLMAGETRADAGQVVLGRDETLGYLPQEAPRAHDTSILSRVLSGDPVRSRLRARLAQAMAAVEADDGGDEAQSVRGCEALAEAQEAFDAAGGQAQEAYAKEILAGLGFTDGQLAAGLASLSGGWWMRVELARLLLVRPTYLLLDEPTNHLDLPSREWLEGFLGGYTGAWVVASHDRHFLGHMPTGIAELGPDGILQVPGTFDDYLEASAALAEQEAHQEAVRARKLAHMQAFVDRFRAKASKASQVQSRVKAIGRERALRGRRQQAVLSQVKLPTAPRSGDVVLDLAHLTHAFGERRLYDNFSWTLRRGERVALIGPNGAGKSTLLKMAARVLAPDQGVVTLGTHVFPYYFAQHQLDVLDPGLSVIEQLQVLCPDMGIGQARALLGAFLFGGDAIDKQVGVLSGGEKSKLVLAQMVSQPHNLLLLDEPTNHLDMASCEVLEAALARYRGTLVTISHDRAFIDHVATTIVQVRPGAPPRVFPGDYAYFLDKSAAIDRDGEGRRGAPAAPRRGAAAPPPPPPPYHRRREEARAESQRAGEVARLEAEITDLEVQIQALDQALCDPSVFADARRGGELLGDRRLRQERLDEAMARWESLASAPAGAGRG